MPEPSIFDYLAKKDISELTIAELNSATKSTNIDISNLEFWQGIITLNRVLQDSRTFPHGLPIPGTGDVHILTIADGSSSTLAPTGSEIWRVVNLDVDNCSVAFIDGDGNLSPITASQDSKWVPLEISANLYLAFSNASGSEQKPSIAYFKVAL